MFQQHVTDLPVSPIFSHPWNNCSQILIYNIFHANTGKSRTCISGPFCQCKVSSAASWLWLALHELIMKRLFEHVVSKKHLNVFSWHIKKKKLVELSLYPVVIPTQVKYFTNVYHLIHLLTPSVANNVTFYNFSPTPQQPTSTLASYELRSFQMRLKKHEV